MSELPKNSKNPQKAVANDRLLAVFDGLERPEQTAWLALFSAQTCRATKYGDTWNTGCLFGKAECGWVDFEKVWLGKFVDFGWLEIVEVRRFKALGIPGQPESAEYEFKATQNGGDVREAYWERLESRSENAIGDGVALPQPCSAPVGSRSNLSFAKLYEMSRSKQMEWSRLTLMPYYYHAKFCSRKQGYDCGHDCSGSWGFHAAQDAADIRLAGWKPNVTTLAHADEKLTDHTK